MNKQGKTGIEWTDYTWSPITGCNHGCSYCYARRIAMRFDGHFNPTFHEKRLKDKMPLKPSKIFVGSMSDVFGNWIPREWIDKILDVVRDNPRHTFQFLTKNPERYEMFDFPDNVWLGTTIDYDNLTSRRRIEFLWKKKNYKFVSCEPMLGDFEKYDFTGIDLVIAGAMTGAGAIKPKQEWIDGIRSNKTIQKIFWKNNIINQ